MISIEYGEVQCTYSWEQKELRHKRNGDIPCPSCGAYANWHFGDCPKWREIVLKQIRALEPEPEVARPNPVDIVVECIHDNESGSCWECYNQ